MQLEDGHNPDSPLRRKVLLKLSKQAGYEFCDVTSIHGVKQCFGSDKFLPEKVWWVTVFIISLYLCLSQMYSVYRKWERDPIIVSFDQHPQPIYSIPFPAITICPETKVKSSTLNLTETFILVRSRKLDESMDSERVRKLMALLQLCDYQLYDRNENATADEDILQLLRRLAIPSFEVFNACLWRASSFRCLNLFKTTLTEKGFCFTFNMIGNNELLRKEELDSRYAFNSETRESHWDLDTGYRQGGVFPFRVVAGDYNEGLKVMLLAKKVDMDYFCGDKFQGFRVLLHMPNEYPQLSSQFFRIPLNQELIVTVTPRVMSTDNHAMLYSADKRNCYHGTERYLRFFRIYNRRNCEVECLTNITLQLCSCVRFWMPRPVGAPLCGLRDNPCAEKAMSNMIKAEAAKVKGESVENAAFCNCMPSCTHVEYQTQISQADWEWQQGGFFDFDKRQPDDVHQSKMVIYFKESHFIPISRSEINSISDLFASAGGLMGLFMGVSLISLVELLYYCTVRPFTLWKLSRRKRSSVWTSVHSANHCSSKASDGVQ
ncbi:pickpocket protein 28-like isoform X1 [Culex pipiens pallens]|uniref:pickpocket protein 28-like isoform X1 n=1 Tax=Culex pipiens pallens TaxID=42434 RepID=UPI0019540742|nr:pickpocket protein 28-like isoform X1 [Culex pipiens pallens]